MLREDCATKWSFESRSNTLPNIDNGQAQFVAEYKTDDAWPRPMGNKKTNQDLHIGNFLN